MEKISSDFWTNSITRLSGSGDSPIQLRCITPSGEHMITVPMHDEIAPGTLHDILTRVAVRKGILKEELIIMLSRKRKGR